MKIGFALSGGGARGLAHIGIVKALGEMGIKPDVISGVSAGAIVGAYFAAGFAADEILEVATKTDMFSFKALAIGKTGLFRPRSLKAKLEKNMPAGTFEQLRIPLIVTTTDLVKAELFYIYTGELIPALLASAAIPMVYLPVEYGDKLLVDGGILNNLPIEPLSDICDIIIGSHVNPIDKTVKPVRFRTVIDRSIHIAISNNVYQKRDKCNLFIEPPALSSIGLFEMYRAKEVAKIGYDYVMNMKAEIEKMLRKW